VTRLTPQTVTAVLLDAADAAGLRRCLAECAAENLAVVLTPDQSRTLVRCVETMAGDLHTFTRPVDD
jgi:hypothetical protein